MTESSRVAYFSMEVALDPDMPTYAGGLGILAGDTVRAAADLGVPMVAVTLLYREGYFFQKIDASGRQTEEPVHWPVNDFVTEEAPRISVVVDGHEVQIRAWRYDVAGMRSHRVPVFLLDTDLPENEAWFRRLTYNLYGGDAYYRLCQELVLGIGGVRMLRALGYGKLARYHMNEGHAGLLAVELLEESRKRAGRDLITQADVDEVRRLCVFTTHTPVAAGHDKFGLDWAARVAGIRSELLELDDVIRHGSDLNMTYLALNLSHYVNGVAKRHGEVSRDMFAGYRIEAITNGVHAVRWTSEPIQGVFDLYMPGWREDNFSLRGALSIPREELWAAHEAAKDTLVRHVNETCNAGFDGDHLTLGFARRAAPYKRGALPLSDLDRLRSIAKNVGPIQIVYAGKAHPGDEKGTHIIQRIFQAREALRGDVPVVYLPNYDMRIAGMMVAGVDVWLNTPEPPLEASGTSGMKAALNGVPSLSVLDGWWLEGCIEGVTGWAVGELDGPDSAGRDRWQEDAASLYDKLEHVVVPMFYQERNRFIDVMRQCIALNGSFFNTQRMVEEYVVKAYFG